MPQRSSESSQAGAVPPGAGVDGDGPIHLVDKSAEFLHLFHHEVVLEMRLIRNVIDEFVVPSFLADVVGEEPVGLLERRRPFRRKRLQPEELLGRISPAEHIEELRRVGHVHAQLIEAESRRLIELGGVHGDLALVVTEFRRRLDLIDAQPMLGDETKPFAVILLSNRRRCQSRPPDRTGNQRWRAAGPGRAA